MPLCQAFPRQVLRDVLRSDHHGRHRHLLPLPPSLRASQAWVVLLYQNEDRCISSVSPQKMFSFVIMVLDMKSNTTNDGNPSSFHSTKPEIPVRRDTNKEMTDRK